MAASYDLLIRNATVIDGTCAQRFDADIAVTSGKISEIGELSGKAKVELDGKGKIVAPGFIDAHTHDDRLMLSAGDMAPKVSQGVTTVVAGNCGISLSPMPDGMEGAPPAPLDLLDNDGKWFRFPTFGAYVEELHAHPASVNCALLVGHMTLRVATMDHLDRAATKAEIARMRDLVREALGAGAIGFSSGLYYELSNAAPAEEVVQIAQP